MIALRFNAAQKISPVPAWERSEFENTMHNMPNTLRGNATTPSREIVHVLKIIHTRSIALSVTRSETMPQKYFSGEKTITGRKHAHSVKYSLADH